MRERNTKDTLAQYEIIIAQLTEENEELRRQVTEVTADAKLKVEEFGAKLTSLMSEKNTAGPTSNGHRRSDNEPFLSAATDRPSLPNEQMFPTISSNVDGWEGLHQYISNH